MGGLFSFLNGSNEDRLFKACASNDMMTVKEVLDKILTPGQRDTQGKLDSIRDSSGRTPLMVAAEVGALPVIHLLYARGASINARHPEHSATALHIAAMVGQRDACLTLLDLGADATALNLRGFTAIDIARLRNHAVVVRAIERRISLFYGWLKWERSSMIQAGLGKVLGASVKEALQKKFGGEWRESWVVVTKLTGKASSLMMCPKCRSQFIDHRTPGAKITCPSCATELHIPSTPVVSILELAIYGSPQDARPQTCFPLNLVSVESEFRVPDMRMMAMKLYLQRPAVAPTIKAGAPQISHGLVDVSGKEVLWAQSTLTMKATEIRSTKKVVFAVDDNAPARKHLARFLRALRSSPVDAVAFAQSEHSADGALGSGDLVNIALEPIEPPVRTNSLSRPWTCSICTLDNLSDVSVCSACDTPREASPLDVARLRQSQTSSSDLGSPSNKRLGNSASTRGMVVAPPPLEQEFNEEDLPIADEENSYSNQEIPLHFLCPISGELMEDPVVTVDGLSFERRVIEEHFANNGPTSPVTLMPLESTVVCPNLALRRAIQEWKSNIPVAAFAVTVT